MALTIETIQVYSLGNLINKFSMRIDGNLPTGYRLDGNVPDYDSPAYAGWRKDDFFVFFRV